MNDNKRKIWNIIWKEVKGFLTFPLSTIKSVLLIIIIFFFILFSFIYSFIMFFKPKRYRTT